MDFPELRRCVERQWQVDVMPTLLAYIAIPCESPAFDKNWIANGHIERAATLLANWAREALREMPDVTVDIIRLPARTPLILIDVPGSAAGAPVLLYGHFDKQPAMTGWARGKGPWTPVIEGERLYGRGGADDGYAIFSAITAILALRAQDLRHPRCMILIEGCEESNSADLPAYVEHLASRIGGPALVIALDAFCGNYDQLWLTTSLRGQVAGTLSVRTLTEGVHSGDASGVVPSSFRIARQLLSRVEDVDSGEITVAELFASIPDERREQAAEAAAVLGSGVYENYPLQAGTHPVTADLTTLLLNRTWRPQLTITGVSGLPAVADAAAVMQPVTALKLSMRLPPTVDPEGAGQRLKSILEADPPYGCDVSFTIEFATRGWNAPAVAPWLEASLNEASQRAFGLPMRLVGGGGGIPFLTMLGERFPEAQFVVTGVLGPRSNAHGPNEFLHLPTVKRLTEAVACILHDAGRFAAQT
jgi:acetylornithine deacetylase/succinyl-diaminopimelate desuccinylase-like protein